jgi:hypothetical protein
MPSAVPPVQRTLPVQERDPTKSGNTFERYAGLALEAAADQAQRLSQNLNEQAPNSREVSDAETKDAWNFNPFGSLQKANAAFWQIHDQVLGQTGDHSQAETQAMQQVFPMRLKLAQVGVAGPERQVALAEQLRKVADGDLAPSSATVASDHAETATRIRQASGRV